VARQILGRDFDKDLRPPGRPNPDNAVKVRASIQVIELSLCERRQELTVGGYFWQRWNDPRLAYDFGEGSNGESRITLRHASPFKRDSIRSVSPSDSQTCLPSARSGCRTPSWRRTGRGSCTKCSRKLAQDPSPRSSAAEESRPCSSCAASPPARSRRMTSMWNAR